jgi:hypothetical protein
MPATATAPLVPTNEHPKRTSRTLIQQIVSRIDASRPTGLTARGRAAYTRILRDVHRTTPLDLVRLRDASTFDFEHDVSGIVINCELHSGRLLNHFVPRCARK